MARSDRSVRRPSGGGLPSRPHRRLDSVSLIFGTTFLGVAFGWMLTAQGALSLNDLGWYLPLLLTVVGVLGVLVSRRR